MTTANPDPSTARYWLLDDGRRGHFRQAHALAQALAGRHRAVIDRIPVEVRLPWSWPGLHRLPLGPVAHQRQWAGRAAPDLLIACGRRGAIVSRWLKRHLEPAPQNIQILCPPGRLHDYDAVILPAHDGINADNSIQVIGSLSEIDQHQVERLRATGSVAHTGGNLLWVFLIGGPSRHFRFSQKWFAHTMKRLRVAARQQGAQLVCITSRRTPAWVAGYQADNETWLHWPTSDVEYQTRLAAADGIVVSADSVNMICEACSVGVPVCVTGTDHAKGKLLRFFSQLEQQSRLTELEDLVSSCSQAPLRQLAAVISQLRQLGIPQH